MTETQGKAGCTTGRIPMRGGWYLVRDDDPSSKQHFGCWFLADPNGFWVAKFWDGHAPRA